MRAWVWMTVLAGFGCADKVIEVEEEDEEALDPARRAEADLGKKK